MAALFTGKTAHLYHERLFGNCLKSRLVIRNHDSYYCTTEAVGRAAGSLPEQLLVIESWRAKVKFLHLFLKELRHGSYILKTLAKLFKIIISNLFQSLPSSALLVPFCCRITSLVIFFLSKPLFLGFATF